MSKKVAELPEFGYDAGHVSSILTGLTGSSGSILFDSYRVHLVDPVQFRTLKGLHYLGRTLLRGEGQILAPYFGKRGQADVGEANPLGVHSLSMIKFWPD